LRRARPAAIIIEPIRAMAHAGKPVNGSSAGAAAAPLTPFAALLGWCDLVGGVETPAVSAVVVGLAAGDVDVVGGLDVVVGAVVGLPPAVVVVVGVLVLTVVVVVGVLVLTVVVVVDVLVDVDEVVVVVVGVA
jgi:hypothetical protein